MQIHNFYNDLLHSIGYLFDRVIFKSKTLINNEGTPSDFIRSYQYNFANRTFSLSKNDYKTTYEYPAAIVEIKDDQYSFGERTTIIQRTPILNINQIPVLHDIESKNIIHLQEEQCLVNFSVRINCESQYQAKEIEFRVKRYLPFNKYIRLFKFTSFLEIHPKTLFDLGMKEETTTNIFTKPYKNFGDIIYCYSVLYEPLIKLNSSSVSISDSKQSSFPVDFDITYHIQMPMWLCSEKYSFIEKIDMDFVQFGTDPVSYDSCKALFRPQDKNVKRSVVISYPDQFRTYTTNTDDSVIIGIGFDKRDFLITHDMHFNIFDTIGQMHFNVDANLIDVENNEVRFHFTKEIYNYSVKPNVVSPLIVQFINGES